MKITILIFLVIFSSPDFKMGKSLKFSNDTGRLSDAFEILLNNSVVDTGLTSFGLKYLSNDYIAYLKINTFKVDVDSQFFKIIYGEGFDFLGYPIDLMVRNENTYFSIEDIVDEYSPGFSMPIFEGDIIYFWGIKYIKERYTSEISAISFNYLTREVTKIYLHDHLLETDYNDIYFRLKIENKFIIFPSSYGTFRVDFKLQKFTEIN